MVGVRIVLKILMSVIIFTGLAACGQNSNITQGGQDSGGGDTRGSDQKFIFEVFTDKKRLLKELEEILWLLDPKASFLEKNKNFIILWKKKFKSSNINLANKLETLQVLEECLSHQGKSKSASVTDFNINGEICISGTHLSQLPPESLRKQVHALLFHEISHLLGYNEDHANHIQSIILAHYDSLFTKENSNSHSEEIFMMEVNNSKNLLYEIVALPDNYFASGQILKDKNFINNYNGSSRLIFPVLIKAANSLLATIESRAQTNPQINLETAKESLNQIALLPYKMDELRNIIYHGGQGNFYDPLYFKQEKTNNYLFLKKEYQKAIVLLESVDERLGFINELYGDFWRQ